MGTSLEDLRMLREAEEIADGIWEQVAEWKPFARNVVGEQLARAADSIGANIAEAFGRYHYGEKLKFLYYARGSLFETKYWLNRTLSRELIPSEQGQDYITKLTVLARQINAFAASLKAQRQSKQSKRVREEAIEYTVDMIDEMPIPLFNEDELNWLQTTPNNLQSPNLPISNLPISNLYQ